MVQETPRTIEPMFVATVHLPQPIALVHQLMPSWWCFVLPKSGDDSSFVETRSWSAVASNAGLPSTSSSSSCVTGTIIVDGELEAAPSGWPKSSIPNLLCRTFQVIHMTRRTPWSIAATMNCIQPGHHNLCEYNDSLWCGLHLLVQFVPGLKQNCVTGSWRRDNSIYRNAILNTIMNPPGVWIIIIGILSAPTNFNR